MFDVFQNSLTALHVASKGGYLEVVNMLLEQSPNVNAVDKVRESVLYILMTCYMLSVKLI